MRDPAVRIVPHDPGWAAQAQAELDRIAAALGPVALRLDHVGSTAVPGLGAKPILDLQVSVAVLVPREPWLAPLTALGYLLVEDVDFPDYPFLGRPAARPRTHHVHVCRAGSHEEHRHLAVREYLRAHPSEAAAYEQVKREVVARHPEDRLAYMAGKDAAVQALEARALAWAGRRPEMRRGRQGSAASTDMGPANAAHPPA